MTGTSAGAKKAALTRGGRSGILPEENPNIFQDRKLYGKVDSPFRESKTGKILEGLDDLIDKKKATASGTSAGAVKAWKKRKRGGGKDDKKGKGFTVRVTLGGFIGRDEIVKFSSSSPWQNSSVKATKQVSKAEILKLRKKLKPLSKYKNNPEDWIYDNYEKFITKYDAKKISKMEVPVVGQNTDFYIDHNSYDPETNGAVQDILMKRMKQISGKEISDFVLSTTGDEFIDWLGMTTGILEKYGNYPEGYGENNEEEVPKQIPIRKITKSGKPSTNVAKYTKSGKTYGENVDDDIKHVEKQIEWSKDQPLRLQYFKDKLKKLKDQKKRGSESKGLMHELRNDIREFYSKAQSYEKVLSELKVKSDESEDPTQKQDIIVSMEKLKLKHGIAERRLKQAVREYRKLRERGEQEAQRSKWLLENVAKMSLVESLIATEDDHLVPTQTCPDCDGDGDIPADDPVVSRVWCERCGGSGKIGADEKLDTIYNKRKKTRERKIKAQASGTSAGAKKAWLKRKRGGGSDDEVSKNAGWGKRFSKKDLPSYDFGVSKKVVDPTKVKGKSWAAKEKTILKQKNIPKRRVSPSFVDDPHIHTDMNEELDKYLPLVSGVSRNDFEIQKSIADLLFTSDGFDLEEFLNKGSTQDYGELNRKGREELITFYAEESFDHKGFKEDFGFTIEQLIKDEVEFPIYNEPFDEVIWEDSDGVWEHIMLGISDGDYFDEAAGVLGKMMDGEGYDENDGVLLGDHDGLYDY